MSDVPDIRNDLPTAKFARALRELMASIEELDQFAGYLERAREVDPTSGRVAAGMGSLHARLVRLADESRAARDLAGFYVRYGREVG